MKHVCRIVTYKYKERSYNIDIEKSISTTADNISNERKIFVLVCFHISADKQKYFFFVDQNKTANESHCDLASLLLYYLLTK